MKYKPDFFVAHLGQFVLRHVAHQLVVQPVFTGCGRIQAANNIHQRGFARARGPHKRHILAPVDGDADVLQRVNDVVPHFIHSGNMRSLDHIGHKPWFTTLKNLKIPAKFHFLPEKGGIIMPKAFRRGDFCFGLAAYGAIRGCVPPRRDSGGARRATKPLLSPAGGVLSTLESLRGIRYFRVSH